MGRPNLHDPADRLPHLGSAGLSATDEKIQDIIKNDMDFPS